MISHKMTNEISNKIIYNQIKTKTLKIINNMKIINYKVKITMYKKKIEEIEE